MLNADLYRKIPVFFAFGLIFLVFFPVFCNAEVIFESATMGPANQLSGYRIYSNFFLGARFQITSETEITSIGGHISDFTYGTPSIFGAIITLNHESDLPSGYPLDSYEVMKSVTCNPPWNTADVRFPMNVTLSPGWYGIVFGAGVLGSSANADAMMPGSGQYNIGSSTYFSWNGYYWNNLSFYSDHPRFVVEGNVAPPPSEIHGSKFYDENANGSWDQGEPNLPGWTIYIDENSNGVFDIGEPNAVTDPNGNYALVNLEPGNYTVSEVMQDGWTQTYPSTGSYNLTIDVNDIRYDIDFGNSQARPGSISGTKFHDLNGNGIKESGEPALSGYTIYLDLNNNDRWDTAEPKVLTDAAGNYKFNNVQPGKYTVREIDRAGWAQTLPGSVGGKLYSCEYLGTYRHSNINVIDPSDGSVVNTFDAPMGLYVLRGGNIAVGPVSIFYIFLNFDSEGLWTFIWELDPVSGEVIDMDRIPFENDLVPVGAAYLDGKVYIVQSVMPAQEPAQSTLITFNPVTDEVENTQVLDMASGDSLSADPVEHVLLWPGGRAGLEAVYRVDPATGEVLSVINHTLYPNPHVCYLDGNIFRTRLNSPYTTFVLDGTTGQELRSFDIDGVDDISGIDACGLGDKEYSVTIGSGDCAGLNFGNVLVNTAVLQGRVYNDNDEVIPGKEVYLDSNNNGKLDNGEQLAITYFNGMYRFNGLAAGGYIVRLADECGYTQISPKDISGKRLKVTAPREVLFDDHRGLLYISTDAGKLLRYDTAKEMFISEFTVGTKLNGMDITPDGQYLYVTEGAPGAQGILHKVNLDTGLVSDISYTMDAYETGGWDIKIGSAGKALMTTMYAGSSSQHLRQIDIATGAISNMSSIPARGSLIGDNSRIFRSDDRKFMLIVESSSDGYLVEYHADSDKFGSYYNRQEYLASASFDLGSDGSMIAYANQKGNSVLFDRDFNTIMPYHGGNIGMLLLDDKGDRFYFCERNTLNAVDLNTFNVYDGYGFGGMPPKAAFLTGESARSGDGRFAALTCRFDQPRPDDFEGVHLVITNTDYHKVGITEGRYVSGADFVVSKGLDGDLNDDGKVNIQDVAKLSQGWGTNDQCLLAGGQSDGKVDLNDLAVLAQNWLADSNGYVLTDDFETGDFSALGWTHEQLPWTITADNPFDGTFCAVSSTVTSSTDDSILKITMQVEEGTVSFMAYPPEYDGGLYFSIDGEIMFTIYDDYSGWGRYNAPVEKGLHTFEWKAFSPSWKSDKAKIDNISFPASTSQ